MRAAGRGVTLVEVILMVCIIFLLVWLLYPRPQRAIEEATRIRCRNNLNQIAKGMAAYIPGFGGGAWYPCPLGRGQSAGDYNGAEWLASLYWTGVVPDPGVFLCPVTRDSNGEGRELGSSAASGEFGPRSVSYAGMHYYSLTGSSGKHVPGAIHADYPPNRPMASDDTQSYINHGERSNGGMSVLFFDSHVEFKTNTDLDLEHAVGQPGGLLERLRN